MPIFIEKHLVTLYVAMALPMMLFLIFAVPPFQVPDEFSHFARSAQISYGEFIGARPDPSHSGGMIDSSYINAYNPSTNSPADFYARPSHHLDFADFPNTVQYGPLFYLPQAVAIGLCRILDAQTGTAFYFARTLNALAAFLIACLALRRARVGRPFLFFILTTPMVLYLMSSLSQDALLLSCACLFVACAPQQARQTRAADFWLAVLLAMIAIARPPYIVLAPLFMLRSVVDDRKRGTLMFFSVIFIVAAWMASISNLHISLRSGVSVAGQLSFLVKNIQAIPSIIIGTLSNHDFAFTIGGIFGAIGVYDSRMPVLFYLVSAIGIAIAATATMAEHALMPKKERLAATMLLIAGILTIYAALYLTWTPVGQLYVEGVQGRYLIPLLMLFALILPREWSFGNPTRLFMCLFAIALCDDFFVIEKVLLRFY